MSKVMVRDRKNETGLTSLVLIYRCNSSSRGGAIHTLIFYCHESLSNALYRFFMSTCANAANLKDGKRKFMQYSVKSVGSCPCQSLVKSFKLVQ